MHISANIVDPLKSEIYPGTIEILNGRIVSLRRETGTYPTFIMPGFIDAHVHIESSMIPPSEFARLAVVHGTVATVSDPHEIANVMGIEGVRWMRESGRMSPLTFCFGVPSCVPATEFETAGSRLGVGDVETLFKDQGLSYLSEVMNFPGVLNHDAEVMNKLRIARELKKPIDGHAPGLTGEGLRKYIAAGISTDHEAFEYREGEEKLSLGMSLIIREGSAAKNFDALSPLIKLYPDKCMFCSDDKHPHDLVKGHINELIRRGLGMGIDLMTLLKCASINPIRHYGLDVGLLRIGDRADFIEVGDLKRLDILKTYLGGVVAAEEGKSLLSPVAVRPINSFNTGKKSPADFAVPARPDAVNIMEAMDNQIITGRATGTVLSDGNNLISDPEHDLLKIAVVNRYEDKPPAIGFAKNFGLKKGAIASSVAHDCHNIIAVGVTDGEICEAVNLIIEAKGGLSVVWDQGREVLPLPVAGLMSDKTGPEVAGAYARMDRRAKELGSLLSAPFMTLSFMALLVIPRLKLGDHGLFDGEAFRFIDLYA